MTDPLRADDDEDLLTCIACGKETTYAVADEEHEMVLGACPGLERHWHAALFFLASYFDEPCPIPVEIV
jgi:hypothetical protein